MSEREDYTNDAGSRLLRLIDHNDLEHSAPHHLGVTELIAVLPPALGQRAYSAYG